MLRTAEAVTLAHPDKVCDQISDAVLDACLEQDPLSRVAIECLGGHGAITVCGEMTTTAKINIRDVARDVYRACGYMDEPGIFVNVVEQSPEIGHGVDQEGAGDQGIMVGYACDETPELMPLAVMLSRKIAKVIGKRDGKTQVTTENGKVVRVLTSVCGTQNHIEGQAFEQTVREIVEPYLSGNHPSPLLQVKEGIPQRAILPFTQRGGLEGLMGLWLRNPNGAWTIGGFRADTGLTGRKLAVDNYGPNIPIGGGCFSGKDATKVDRSAAYMARKIAVDYLRRTGAHEVFVHLAYAIGVAEPLMAVVTIDGKQEPVHGYDLRPRAIIEQLDLRRPQFRETARYGHFGNGFIWDR